jgi:tRNA dimethylallyltransferase
LEGYRFSSATGDEKLRGEFEEIAKTHGNQKLYEILAGKLPEIAARLHPNDTRRIIRALEVYHHSGEEVSQNKVFHKGHFIYDAAVIGLNMDRALLYERINRRVDIMVESGLAGEVDALLKTGVSRQSVAMQGIGYKEMAAYLKGECELSEAVYKIKLATRRFAKRQLTLYRAMPYVEWFNADDEEDYGKNLEQIYKLLARKFSIEYNKR